MIAIPKEVQKILDACNLPADFAIEEHSSFTVRRLPFNSRECNYYYEALEIAAENVVSKPENITTITVEATCTTEDGIDVDLAFELEYATDPDFIALVERLKEAKLRQQEKAKKVQSAKAAKKKLTVTEQLRKIALENPELVQQIAKELGAK